MPFSFVNIPKTFLFEDGVRVSVALPTLRFTIKGLVTFEHFAKLCCFVVKSKNECYVENENEKSKMAFSPVVLVFVVTDVT